MADDKRITGLEPLPEAASDDVLAIVDVAGPSDVTKKITTEDLFASPQPIGSSFASTGEFTTLDFDGGGATISEFSTDGTLSGDSDTAVPTEKAIKTYVDNATLAGTSGSSGSSGTSGIAGTSGTSGVAGTSGTSGASGTSGTSGASGTSGTSGTSPVTAGGTDNAIAIYDGTAAIQASSIIIDDINNMTAVNSITMAIGTNVNEFSIDGEFLDDSDLAVPTEKAVKTYVDNALANLNPDKIWEGDSFVEVVDDGTNVGYVTIVADGTEVAYFDAEASTQRIGKSQAGRLETADTSVVISVGATEVFNATSDIQTVGGDDSYIYMDQTGGTSVVGPNSVEAMTLDENGIQLFTSGPTINEFTNNTPLTDSTTSLVTEYAIKTAIEDATLAGTSGSSGTSGVSGTSGSSGISGTSGSSGTSGVSGTSGSSGTSSVTASGVDQAVARYNGTTAIEGSGVFIDDLDNVTGVNDLSILGDLFVDGTTFVVHNQEVTTSDNLIVINYGEVGPGVTSGHAGFEIDRGSLTDYQFMFVEATNDFRIGEIGDLQAVATREDTPIDLRVPWWNDTAKRFDTTGDTYVTISDSTDAAITTVINTFAELTVDADGMSLKTGVTVNKISADGELAGNSDYTVPTEKAVKTYVDAHASGLTVRHVDSDSTAISGDAILVDSTDGTTMVYVVPSPDGRVVVKKISADDNLVIVIPQTGDIDGQSQKSIDTQYESYEVLSDGIDLFIM